MRVTEPEQLKQVVDVAAATGTAAALMQWVPPITAVLTLVWVAIRIWETETIKELTGRKPKED